MQSVSQRHRGDAMLIVRANMSVLMLQCTMHACVQDLLIVQGTHVNICMLIMHLYAWSRAMNG
jgi:nitrate reductase gamma subunit